MSNFFKRNLIRTIILFAVLGGAFLYYTKSGMGKAPTVKLGDLEINVGETTCSEFSSKGYSFDGPGYTSTLEANTWTYLINVKKDDKGYGSLTIYNKTGKDASIKDCTVGEFSLSPDEISNGVNIDGVDVTSNMSYEDIKSSFKDFSDVTALDSEILFKRGDYSIEFRYDDGKDQPFTYIFVKYDFGAKYDTK